MARDLEHAWRPSRIVSLLTDFGHTEPYVGLMHAVLLSLDRELSIVDLTHGVEPQDVRAGAFHLAHSWRYFPKGSVHVAVVDPGVGTARRILVARESDHVFLAPDNGLLSFVLTSESEVRELDVARFALPDASRTFHGRDVFAPAAARIASGLDPREVGVLCRDPRRIEFPRAHRVGAGRLEAHLLFADRFGNLVTDAARSDLAGSASDWEALVGETRIAVLGTYADARRGELCAVVNSFGCLELAVAGGNARDRLKLAPGATVVFRRR